MVALLSAEEVDSAYREPFILTGYRRIGASYYQCLRSAFSLHNEVVNFWTHFIPLLVWLVWLLYLALSWEDFFQPFHYPMLCYWTGACVYTLFSSMAHLFSCKSYKVNNVCAMLDYMGIALYGFCSDMTGLFYFSSTTSLVFSYKAVVICIELFLVVFATLVNSLSRFSLQDHRFLFRVLTFVPAYLCSIGPFIHREALCRLHGTDCVPDTARWHMFAIFFTILMIIFYISKIPERIFPGKFDIFFQSHQFFHLCTVSVTSTNMYFTIMEIKSRKTILSTVEGAMPTLQTTFVPLLAASVVGTAIVCAVSWLYSDIMMISHKKAKKE
jgi:predicted membrane channel-forming protein YqfA (hemolysin III family)